MEENQTQVLTQALAKEHKLNKTNIVMAILLVLSLAAATTFGILWATKNTDAPIADSNSSSDTKNTQTTETISQNTEQEKSASAEPEIATNAAVPLVFDASLIVNGDENMEYYGAISDSIGSVSTTGDLIRVLSTGNNIAKVNVYWPDMNTVYGSDHAVQESRAENFSEFEVQFPQRITDIFIGGIGQMIGNESIFYLMEDGTVERTDIRTAAKNNDFSTHTKVDGLENIVKFYEGGGNTIGAHVGGYGTSFAQAADGKIYLLFHARRTQ